MATTTVSPNVSDTTAGGRGGRGRRSGLDAAMLVGTFGPAAVYATVQLSSWHMIPPVMIFMSIYVLCGIVVATGWRWAFFLPLVFCTVGLIGEFSNGFPVFILQHPSTNYTAFVSFTINYPLLATAILAAAVKLVQTFRHETPHLPRWLTPALGAVPGVIFGAMLIGLIGQPATAGGAAAAQAGTETVHLEASTFAPDIVAVHKGDTLAIVDDVPVPHTLTNGTWSASNQPVPGVEPGAVILSNINLNNTSVTVGPFTTAGTYHIYCTVHPGMNLTIIVQ